VVTKQSSGRSTISISLETKNALNSIKHEGQSYNGLIQEVVKFWKEKKDEYWARKRKQRVAESVGAGKE